jgi:hypothetical protein
VRSRSGSEPRLAGTFGGYRQTVELCRTCVLWMDDLENGFCVSFWLTFSVGFFTSLLLHAYSSILQVWNQARFKMKIWHRKTEGMKRNSPHLRQFSTQNFFNFFILVFVFVSCTGKFFC